MIGVQLDLLIWTLFTIFILILIEIILKFLIDWLRTDYQWLITSRDISPLIDSDSLENFINKSHDSELGWTRKPNTSGLEMGRDGPTSYNIDENGSRLNPGFELSNAAISMYGDSFTFCRQVNDNETIAHFLSKKIQKPVSNYGVGNYGLDQALLRLKREFIKSPTKIVIMGVVPETISRVLGVWKHYHEYGNIFGFKPRFILEDGKLKGVKNIVDSKEKFMNLEEHILELQKYDYFYKNKFLKDILKFPFIFSLSKSSIRNISLIFHLILEKIFIFINIFPQFRDEINNKFVLKRNLKVCIELYKKKNIEELMVALVKDFVDFCKINNAIPIMMVMPQLNDMVYIKKNRKYYNDFINEISNITTVIDIAEYLKLEEDLTSYYSNDIYGGHLSKKGNKFVAKIIAKKLSKK